jgi:hypothetical protein
MFKLKPISKEGIELALDKADRYRLLNEPIEAESICRDVLEIDPENQRAIIILILSITDQFSDGIIMDEKQALRLLPHLKSEYEQNYYAGIVFERQAKAALKRGTPGYKYDAYEWFCDAMNYFEKAETLRPPGNDDAILRWNTCARLIMKNDLGPRQESYTETFLE